MALRRKKRRGRRPREGKLARSEIATLRLDPKLRYFIDLAARTQRRTVSSYLEWAAEQSLGRIPLTGANGRSQSMADEMDQLWDVDDAERFVKLASRYPNLLNHEEQVLWRLIRENQSVWPRSSDEQSLGERGMERLRMHWDRFVAVAKGEANKSCLP
jgi:hypothetical protein